MIDGLVARFLAPVLGLLLAAALAMAGWQAHQAAKIAVEFADYRAAAETQERIREAAARKDEDRTRSRQSEAQDEAYLSLKLSVDDGRRADAAAVSLHQRADTLAAAARCPAHDPAIAAAARQPTPPPICLPTCSKGLTTLREQLLDMPTKLGQPASSASASIRL